MHGNELQYMSGFGGHFESEAVDGALPKGRNSPQQPAFGLYSEQLSGSSFTAPRHENRRSWLYRMRPTADHRPFVRYEGAKLFAPGTVKEPLAPNRLRWSPQDDLPADADFVDGMVTMLANRAPEDLEGVAVHLYRASKSMVRRVFVDADGELLIIPQSGDLRVVTELGTMLVSPGSVGLVPRGVKFRVDVDGEARGYVAENHGLPLRLPDLGPIGANGLANARDFETPVASYEDRDETTEVIQKSLGSLWTMTLDHSPLDVVAWHGNYAPWRYDLSRFNTIGTISYDHPDPSIFTVLTSPSNVPGRANADFVIFPAAMDGGRGHVPPALLPSQRDERGDGPDLRRLRRKGGWLRAGRAQPAQCDERPWAGRRKLEEGERGRAQAGQDRRHDGLHGRELLAVPADAIRARPCPAGL